MSIIRAKHRQANQSVLLQNRLTTFTNPPMRIGDLYIEKTRPSAGILLLVANYGRAVFTPLAIIT